MAVNELRQRVVRRLDEIRSGAIEAAASVHGLERNYIRDLVEGKKESFNQAKLDAVALALKWTVPELLGRVGSAPLLEKVSAGDLLAPLSQIDVATAKRVYFADLEDGEYFALTVEGDSMNRISPEKSTILVNKSNQQLVGGACYVFEHQGGTTYKMWDAKAKSLLPQSTNKRWKPISVKKGDFRIIGRVRRTVMDL